MASEVALGGHKRRSRGVAQQIRQASQILLKEDWQLEVVQSTPSFVFALVLGSLVSDSVIRRENRLHHSSNEGT